MYHTPNLTGLRKKYIPQRINEGWGLQHILHLANGFGHHVLVPATSQTAGGPPQNTNFTLCFVEVRLEIDASPLALA